MLENFISFSQLTHFLNNRFYLKYSLCLFRLKLRMKNSLTERYLVLNNHNSHTKWYLFIVRQILESKIKIKIYIVKPYGCCLHRCLHWFYFQDL